jgi:hypothetical protein
MLAMLRRVRAWQPPPETGPAIVHCSAGKHIPARIVSIHACQGVSRNFLEGIYVENPIATHVRWKNREIMSS